MAAEDQKREINRLLKQTDKARQTLKESYQRVEDLEAALHQAQEIEAESKRYIENRSRKR